MNFLEIIVYGIVLFCSLIIAWEFAKYGFIGVGIKIPMDIKSLRAAFIGSTTIVIAGILQKYNYANFTLFTNTDLIKTGLIFTGIPLLFLILSRYIFLPRGIPEYNRAQVRMTYWMRSYFEPGIIIKESNYGFAYYPLVQKTLKLFDKAIAYQRNRKNLFYRENLLAAHIDMAMLLRMMNKFNESNDNLRIAENILKKLIEDNPSDTRLLSRKSIILFQQGEIAHVTKNYTEAKRLYRESLNIDEKINHHYYSELTKKLLSEIN